DTLLQSYRNPSRKYLFFRTFQVVWCQSPSSVYDLITAFESCPEGRDLFDSYNVSLPSDELLYVVGTTCKGEFGSDSETTYNYITMIQLKSTSARMNNDSY